MFDNVSKTNSTFGHNVCNLTAEREVDDSTYKHYMTQLAENCSVLKITREGEEKCAELLFYFCNNVVLLQICYTLLHYIIYITLSTVHQ